MLKKITFLITEERYTKTLKWFSCLLILIYIANSYTPLRLHVDMMRYFAIKDCIEFGCPTTSEASKDYLPYGYTVLLLGLSTLGILKSYTLVLINCLFLFTSLYLISKIFYTEKNIYFFVVLALLNWTIIKFTVHPLSEMQYLFFSVISLFFFVKFTRERRLINLLISFIFAAIAFITRTIGITLAAALILSLVWEYRSRLILFITRNKWVFIIMVMSIIIVGFFSKQLGLDHYKDVFIRQFEYGVNYKDVIRWHLIELAEISLNTSLTRVMLYLPQSFKIFFLIFGLLMVFGMFYLLVLRRRDLPFVVSVYLLFYTLLLFNWPFYDPRFWVPILPIFLAAIAFAPLSLCKSKISQFSLQCLGIIYVVMGIISVGYITYTSFNLNALASTQAGGLYKQEYETVFFDKSKANKPGTVDSVIVHLLYRYNK